MKQFKRNIKRKYDDDHFEENIFFYKNKNELMKILTINNAKFKKMIDTIKNWFAQHLDVEVNKKFQNQQSQDDNDHSKSIKMQRT